MQKKVQCVIGTDYPEPIVDQAQAAKLARAKIRAIQKDQAFIDKAKDIHKKLGSRKRTNKRKKRKTTGVTQLSFKLQQ